MANGNGIKNGGDPLTRLYVALIVVAGGVLTGNGFLVRQATVEVDAPDRYRGAQGRALEQAHTNTVRRVDALESNQKRLDEHLQNHPDHALRLSLREAMLRIGHLEVENDQLREELQILRDRN